MSVIVYLKDGLGGEVIMSTSKYTDLTYSYSRAKMLDTCARSYYFSYYASSGGWRQDAAQKNKQIYRLKKLQGLNSIVGVAIHTAITGLIVNPNLARIDFKRRTNQKIRESYRNSMARKDEWIQDPKLFLMIQEIYYCGEVTLETQLKIIDKIDACGEHLGSCRSLNEIRHGADIVTVDELKDFTYNGCKTYVKVDALYQSRDTGHFIVVDWKTGKGSEIEVEQLLLYVFFMHKMYDIPVEAIEARLEYLVDGDCASYRFTSHDMEMAEKIISSGIRKMQKYLFDKEKNIPMPETYFPQNKSSKCNYCNYLEVCFGDEIVVSETEAAKVLAGVGC